MLSELLQLVKEHPDLPVIPMVDGEICGDDFARYFAVLGTCYVGEYVVCEERVYFDREEFCDDLFGMHDDELCERFHYDPMIVSSEKNRKQEEQLDNFLYGIADKVFKPAIIVNIDIPVDFIEFDMRSALEALK